MNNNRNSRRPSNQQLSTQNFSWGKFSLWTALILMILPFSVSCKQDLFSKAKSYVGLNTELSTNNEIRHFQAVQTWFKGSRIGQPFSEDTRRKLRVNPAVQKTFLAYFHVQQQRIGDFQRKRNNESALKELFALEAEEIKQIMLVLAGACNQGCALTDGLAIMLNQRHLRQYIDNEASEPIESLLHDNFADITSTADAERDAFAEALIAKALTGKADPNYGFFDKDFYEELGYDCSQLQNFVSALGGKNNPSACTPGQGGSVSLGLGGGDLATMSAKLPGTSRVFAGIFAGAVGARGPLASYAATGGTPQLSIFEGRDPNQNPQTSPTASPGQPGDFQPPTPNISSDPNLNPTPSLTPSFSPLPTPQVPSDPLSQLISQIFGQDLLQKFQNALQNGAQQGFGLQDSASKRVYSMPVPKAPKPNFDCIKEGFTSGKDLRLCQRHYAVMQNFPMSPNFNSRRISQTGLNLNTSTYGYNFKNLGDKIATPAQDQGQEGACSAFGGTHTLLTNLRQLGVTMTLEARSMWQKQGQQPYMASFLEAAKRMDFQGKRVTGGRDLNGVEDIKSVIDQNRAVYIGSEVDSSWYRPSGGKLSCRGSGGGMRHAYSIQGYDDAKQLLIVKNSWGADWGEDGYYYLSYQCIQQFQQMELYDIQVI
jgi:hypothetical protein